MAAKNHQAGMALNNAGNEKYKRKDYLGAIEDYEKALQLLPRDAVVQRNLRNAKALHLNNDIGERLWRNRQYQEAIAAYSEAARLDPTNTVFQDNLRTAKDVLHAEEENGRQQREQEAQNQRMLAQFRDSLDDFAKTESQSSNKSEGGSAFADLHHNVKRSNMAANAASAHADELAKDLSAFDRGGGNEKLVFMKSADQQASSDPTHHSGSGNDLVSPEGQELEKQRAAAENEWKKAQKIYEEERDKPNPDRVKMANLDNEANYKKSVMDTITVKRDDAERQYKSHHIDPIKGDSQSESTDSGSQTRPPSLEFMPAPPPPKP